VGDSLLMTRDRSMLLPLDHAKALLAFMQPEFGGYWVAAKDLKHFFYPRLLEQTGSGSLTWQSVARALRRINVKKRYKEFPQTAGEWRRVTRTEYYIPSVDERQAQRSSAAT
jgi:hypothetical protein